jgi:hypothetical protein
MLPTPRRRTAQKGGGLLGAIISITIASAAVAGVASSVTTVAAEVAARRQVLCARAAALGALHLHPATLPEIDTASLFPGMNSVDVAAFRDAQGACLVVSRANCGQAQRSFRLKTDDARCLIP